MAAPDPDIAAAAVRWQDQRALPTYGEDEIRRQILLGLDGAPGASAPPTWTGADSTDADLANRIIRRIDASRARSGRIAAVERKVDQLSDRIDTMKPRSGRHPGRAAGPVATA